MSRGEWIVILIVALVTGVCAGLLHYIVQRAYEKQATEKAACVEITERVLVCDKGAVERYTK